MFKLFLKYNQILLHGYVKLKEDQIDYPAKIVIL